MIDMLESCTYKSLDGVISNSATVDTSYEDSLAADLIRECFGNIETLSGVAKL